MIVDVWAQHPTSRHLEHPMFDSLRKWRKDSIPRGEIPLSVTLDAMSNAGVKISLISAWESPAGSLISNKEVAHWIENATNQLFGIASVNIEKPMEAVAEIKDMVKSHGFKGVRILPWLWKLPPTDRLFYPVYVACCELNIPFCTQIGHTGPLMPSEVGRPIYLDQVALDFPELKIVAGHIGYPWVEEAIALTHKHENFYIDTSAYICKRFPERFVQFMRESNCKRIMFGSNYPMLTPKDSLADLEHLQLNEISRKRFLFGNALRVFQLEACDENLENSLGNSSDHGC